MSKDGTSDQLIKAFVVAGSDSDIQNLEATWSILRMEKRSLEFQITFEKPLYVSSAGEPDSLGVLVQDVGYFLSEEGLPI